MSGQNESELLPPHWKVASGSQHFCGTSLTTSFFLELLSLVEPWAVSSQRRGLSCPVYHVSASYLSYWFGLYILTLLIAIITEVENSNMNPKDNWHCFSGIDRWEMSNFSVNTTFILINCEEFEKIWSLLTPKVLVLPDSDCLTWSKSLRF